MIRESDSAEARTAGVRVTDGSTATLTTRGDRLPMRRWIRSLNNADDDDYCKCVTLSLYSWLYVVYICS